MKKYDEVYEVIKGENKSKFKISVAIYARQSVEKAGSISIETQINECLDGYKSIGYAGKVYIFKDVGYSGKNTKRPAFEEMMEFVKCEKIACVYIYKLDRISRNLIDYTNIQNAFDKYRVGFISVNEHYDTTDTGGRTIINLLMLFAQMERENTQLRVTDNYYSRISKDGRWAGGKAPYGFDNGISNGIPSLIKNEKEIEIVKLIFKLFLETPGISLGKLASTLNNKGYISRKGPFTNVSVGRILRNPIYVKADKLLYNYYRKHFCGNESEFEFLNDEDKWNGETSANIVHKRSADSRKHLKKTEYKIYLTNIHGIIDSADFVAIQDRLKNNFQFKKSNTVGKLEELTGILKCAKCGKAIKTYNYPTLSCYSHVALKNCEAVFKPESDISNKEAFEDLRISIGLCVTRYYALLKKTCENAEAQTRKVKSEIEKNEKNIGDLLDNFSDIDNETVKTQIKKKITKLSNRISDLQLEIEQNYNAKRIAEANKNLNYFSMGSQEKQEILRTLIERIELNTDYSFNIVWKDKSLNKISEYDQLDFTTNGRIRIKDELEGKLTKKEFEDLVYDAVGIKVAATKQYCKINGIELPTEFFSVYEDKEKFMATWKLLCNDFEKFKLNCNYKEIKKVKPEFRRVPLYFNSVKEAILYSKGDKKTIEKIKNRSKKNNDIRDDITYNNTPTINSLFMNAIEMFETKVNNNEKMTIAFTVLIKEYLDVCAKYNGFMRKEITQDTNEIVRSYFNHLSYIEVYRKMMM